MTYAKNRIHILIKIQYLSRHILYPSLHLFDANLSDMNIDYHITYLTLRKGATARKPILGFGWGGWLDGLRFQNWYEVIHLSHIYIIF